jgi:hypothetical protein
VARYYIGSGSRVTECRPAGRLSNRPSGRLANNNNSNNNSSSSTVGSGGGSGGPRDTVGLWLVAPTYAG